MPLRTALSVDVGTRLVVAEKPSVARDIAEALGATTRGDGFLHGAGFVVTWALGHLVELPEPHQIDANWRRWSQSSLPLLPTHWPLQVAPRTASQYRVVERLMRDRRIAKIVCATDAGREGELIFRFIYERSGCRKAVDRLWISSMTREAIREGFRNLRPGSAYDALAASARSRAHADWLVGINFTRAYTLARRSRGDVYSVGRVQTPTLAILVERELAIRAFVPEAYYEVTARFLHPASGSDGATYEGTYFDPERERALRAQAADDAAVQAARLPADGELAKAIALRAKGAKAIVEQLESKQQRVPPPLLYDLTELQRDANRLYGFSAKRTLETAQRLYEQRKLITYPRSASRHLTRSVAATLPAVVEAIAPPYHALLAPGTFERPLSARFVDDRKVGDHHAIIPTSASAGRMQLSADEAHIYDLVCRRLLAAWHEDHVYSTTRVVTAVKHAAGVDRYRSHGTRVERLGFRVLDPRPVSNAVRAPTERTIPPRLAIGHEVRVEDARAVQKETRPPPRLSDGALLGAMESAGRTLDDRELALAMKESGLGTPATRAQILETLLDREYVRREGKVLVPTDKGIELIGVVHEAVKSPALTARWETQLKQIEDGNTQADMFLRGIERYVGEVVAEVAHASAAASGAKTGTKRTTAEATALASGAKTGTKRATPEATPLASRAKTGATRTTALRTAKAPAKPRSVSTARWAKAASGEWRIRAAQGLDSTIVLVERRDGRTDRVKLGAAVEPQGSAALYTVESIARSPQRGGARRPQRKRSAGRTRGPKSPSAPRRGPASP